MGRVSEEYMYHDIVSCLAVGLFEVKCWWLPWERAGCCWHFPATSTSHLRSFMFIQFTHKRPSSHISLLASQPIFSPSPSLPT